MNLADAGGGGAPRPARPRDVAEPPWIWTRPLDKMQDLARRLQRLEDIGAIKRLTAHYAIGADRNNNDPEIFAAMMTEDAIWEAEGMMRFEGRDAVVRELHAFSKARIPWSLHFNTNCIVDVAESGKAASMIWYVFETATVTPEKGGRTESMVIGGWYESDIVKTDEGWKFRHIRLFPKLFGRHDLPNWLEP